MTSHTKITDPSIYTRLPSLAAMYDYFTTDDPHMLHPDIRVPTAVLVAYLALMVLCVLSLAIPLPSRQLKIINRGLMLPAILSISAYIYQKCLYLDTAGNRFSPFNATAGFTLRAIDTLLFSGDPHKTFFRIDKPHPPRTLREGLAYSFSFWFTFRGIKWNWKSRKTPTWSENNIPTRTQFIRMHLHNLAWRYVFMDALETFLRKTGFLAYPPLLMNDLSLLSPLRNAAGLAHGVLLWQVIDMTYSLFVIPCVLLRISHVDECPPQFGRLADATTLAAYWATLWHSNWKKPFVGVSLGVTRFFKLPAMFGVFGTFIISGIFHSLIALAAHGGDIRSWSGAGAMLSFAVQPIGLIVERCFMSHILPLLPISVRRSKLFKSLSYLWVTLWLSTTASFAFDEVNQAGLMAKPLLPFSPVRYILDQIYA
ncbi:hypothetical protein J056_002727 [Wallemia ichthyophaga EXF-994]|uniref:Wax synthase domain-containing protein n=1 Tax=Wallemia ichthyophaga (strain EXF-994 / CBS 113033) TaxID=1299270 RepID=R9A9S9_WALI9|nr:uncharacterized protein J056_002727 [Wallemia ichthyophaga EXF-994]EOQ98867.1 hypothetical protein J056_002727 [Wallemia ichthyophaga EXF-994]